MGLQFSAPNASEHQLAKKIALAVYFLTQGKLYVLILEVSKIVAKLTYLSQIKLSPLNNRKETFSILINQAVLKEVT